MVLAVCVALVAGGVNPAIVGSFYGLWPVGRVIEALWPGHAVAGNS